MQPMLVAKLSGFAYLAAAGLLYAVYRLYRHDGRPHTSQHNDRS